MHKENNKAIEVDGNISHETRFYKTSIEEFMTVNDGLSPIIIPYDKDMLSAICIERVFIKEDLEGLGEYTESKYIDLKTGTVKECKVGNDHVGRCFISVLQEDDISFHKGELCLTAGKLKTNLMKINPRIFDTCAVRIKIIKVQDLGKRQSIIK